MKDFLRHPGGNIIPIANRDLKYYQDGLRIPQFFNQYIECHNATEQFPHSSEENKRAIQECLLSNPPKL